MKNRGHVSQRVAPTIKEAIVLPKNEAGFVRLHDTTLLLLTRHRRPSSPVLPIHHGGVTGAPVLLLLSLWGLPFSLNPPPVLSIPLLGHHPILLSSPLPSLSPFL